MAFRIKAFLVVFIFTFSLANAQSELQQLDSLESKRTFFNTEIYLRGGLIKAEKTKQVYNNLIVNKSTKLFNRSRIFLFSSPVFVGGGIYMVYDAIKGTPMVAEIDGVAYPYTVRPIKNVIAGLGIFAVGICLFEYSHEFKAKSVNIYNNKLKSSKSSGSLKLDFGIIDDSRIGFSAKF